MSKNKHFKRYLKKHFGVIVLIGILSLICVAADINLLFAEPYIESYDASLSHNISVHHRAVPRGNVDDNNNPSNDGVNPLCSLDDVVCPNEQTQVASWYDYKLDGIEWSKNHNTCASRDLKRYSMARVTNLENGKSVECYVNDYGPEEGQTPERQIDLSSHAFAQISDLKLGLAEVKIEQL